MGKKRVTADGVQPARDEGGPLYVSFAGKDGASVLKNHQLAGDSFAIREYSTAATTSDINVRAGFNRYDRDWFRPEDALPTDHAGIIQACQAVYRRIGLVRNIIDLMADFASEGLDLIHPVRSQQNFFRKWAEKVDLQGRAHDFMRYMLRDANVICRRKYARIVPAAVTQFTKGDDQGIQEVPDRVLKDKRNKADRLIPWRYVFLSPTIVEKLGGEVGKFYGGDRIGIRLPYSLIRAINSPKDQYQRELVAKLPPEFIEAAKQRKKVVPIDPDKVFVSYYKKDDWEDWGTPFLYAVLDDIMLKDKMRQADIAALDGVINVIRLWKLGKSDKQILPTKGAVNKLLAILENNVGGGCMDIVWDDMIDLQVEYPPTDKILGAEKYGSVNTDIVRGLGVPDSLLGGSDLSTRNAQTAFVQLKTLVQRLEYVRSKALDWINNELKLVADAMGFKTLPTVVFGTMSLRDEAAEKALVIQLLDRGVVSVETVHRAFGVDYLIELEHLREEEQLRVGEKPIIERAGPYYRPLSVLEAQTESQLSVVREQGDIAAQSGGGDNPQGDQPRNDSTPSGPGRPAKKPNPKPRDQRTPKTLSTVYETIADSLFEDIDTIVNPMFLESKGLKTLRNTSTEQHAQLEGIKWTCLCSLKPGDKVTQAKLEEALVSVGTKDLAAFDAMWNDMVQRFLDMLQRQPNAAERRKIMTAAWATVYTNKGEEQ